MNALCDSDLLTQVAVHEGCSWCLPGSSEHSVGVGLEFHHDGSAAGEGLANTLALVQAHGCRMRFTTCTGGSAAIVAVQAAWLHSPLHAPHGISRSVGALLLRSHLGRTAGEEGGAHVR